MKVNRKLDCTKYSDCLHSAANLSKNRGSDFDCTGCEEYEATPQDVEDEFERELQGSGEMGKAIVNKGKTCSVEGCEKPASVKGLCWMHYTRKRLGKEMAGPERRNIGRYKKAPKTQTDKEKNLTDKRNLSVPPKAMGPKLEPIEDAQGLRQAVEILIQYGFLSREKLNAAMELVKE